MPGISRISGYLSKGAAGSHWGAVALADLQDYFAALEARGLSARSRARRLSALRQFFRFLQREEQVESNPVELLDSPRLPQRLPQVMGEADVAALLAAPDPGTPGGLQGPGPPGGALCHGPPGLGAGGPDLQAVGPAAGRGAPPGQRFQRAGGAHGGPGGGKIAALPGAGAAPAAARPGEPLCLHQPPGRQALPPGFLEAS